MFLPIDLTNGSVSPKVQVVVQELNKEWEADSSQKVSIPYLLDVSDVVTIGCDFLSIYRNAVAYSGGSC